MGRPCRCGSRRRRARLPLLQHLCAALCDQTPAPGSVCMGRSLGRDFLLLIGCAGAARMLSSRRRTRARARRTAPRRSCTRGGATRSTTWPATSSRTRTSSTSTRWRGSRSRACRRRPPAGATRPRPAPPRRRRRRRALSLRGPRTRRQQRRAEGLRARGSAQQARQRGTWARALARGRGRRRRMAHAWATRRCTSRRQARHVWHLRQARHVWDPRRDPGRTRAPALRPVRMRTQRRRLPEWSRWRRAAAGLERALLRSGGREVRSRAPTATAAAWCAWWRGRGLRARPAAGPRPRVWRAPGRCLGCCLVRLGACPRCT